MATWSITPTEGVTDKGNGKYTFTSPVSGSITYTITYTDDNGNISQTTHTVNAGDCINCDCNKLNITKNLSTVDASGFTGQVASYNITNEYCKTLNPTIAAVDASNITITRVSNGKIIGKIAKNEGSSKTVTFKLSYNGVTCDNTLFSVSQKAGCNCDSLTHIKTYTGNFPKTGVSNIQVATISLISDCSDAYDNITLSGSNVFSLSSDKKQIIANVPARGTGESSITYSYKIKFNGVECTGKGDSITQNAGDTPCGCSNISHTAMVNSIDNGSYNGRVASYKLTGDCNDYTKIGIQGDSEFTLDTTNHEVKANISENTSTSSRSFSYKLTYDGTVCDGKGNTIRQDGEEPTPEPCEDFAVAGEAYVKCGVQGSDYGGRGTCGYMKSACYNTTAIESIVQYCNSETDTSWISDLKTYYDTDTHKYKWRAKVTANNTGHDRVAVFKITTSWGGIYYFRTVQAGATTPEDPNCQNPGSARFLGTLRPSTYDECFNPLSCS